MTAQVTKETAIKSVLDYFAGGVSKVTSTTAVTDYFASQVDTTTGYFISPDRMYQKGKGNYTNYAVRPTSNSSTVLFSSENREEALNYVKQILGTNLPKTITADTVWGNIPAYYVGDPPANVQTPEGAAQQAQAEAQSQVTLKTNLLQSPTSVFADQQAIDAAIKSISVSPVFDMSANTQQTAVYAPQAVDRGIASTTDKTQTVASTNPITKGNNLLIIAAAIVGLLIVVASFLLKGGKKK